MYDKKEVIIHGEKRNISGDFKGDCMHHHAAGPYWCNHGAWVYAADYRTDCLSYLLLSDGGGGVSHKEPQEILPAACDRVGAVGAPL